MKLHAIAAGLALFSGAALAQDTPTTTPPATTPNLPALPVPATPAGDKPLVDVKPNDDGTLGGTVSAGQEGASGTASGSLDPNNQTGKTGGTLNVANEQFGKLDLNHNGSLSRDEIRVDVKLLGRFNKMDTNGNGTVDEDEFALANTTTIKPPAGTPGESKANAKATDKAKDKKNDLLPGGG